jgi:signal transduction histidine kinase
MDKWLESFALTSFLRSADTAHDLKTPLNVAVLNLELLRMRLRKLAGGEDDEKIASYAKSIDQELRRMARIFDTFFILSTPPKNEGDPVAIDLCPLCSEIGGAAGYEVVSSGEMLVRAHESRIRQALKLFFDGASHLLKEEQRRIELSSDSHFRATIEGQPRAEDFDLSKIFKFYYTDSDGNADLSLAAARLIAETYGGGLNAAQESDKVMLVMSFPLGEK